MKSLSEVPLGSVVFETIEKYEATVVAGQFHLNGCQRVILQEKRLDKDGKSAKRESVDIQSVEMRQFNNDGFVCELDSVLGLPAVNKASGYEGRIIIIGIDPSGGRNYALQSSGRTSTGERIESEWCEEEFLELLEPRRDEKKEPAMAGSAIESPM